MCERKSHWRHKLERRHQIAALNARSAIKRNCILQRIESKHCSFNFIGQRHQFYRNCRDNPENAFGTDEQLLEINSAIVLPQSGKSIKDGSIRQYDFKAQHQFSGHAVAENIDAAGIGADVTANPATSLSAQ